jgi:thiol:disulfide interchange protein DsbA
MKKYLFFLLSLLCLPWFAFANQAPFVAGKDYVILKSAPTNTPTANADAHKVQVIEFFSYGCPWCYRLEPTVEKWLSRNKAKVVHFDRVPVVFEPGWEVYAKAYYTAKSLGVEGKATPLIFDAIHKKGLDLTNEKTLEDIFVKLGVKKTDFDSAFHFSPGVGMQINQGNQMMQAYQVFEVPTLVIAGKYKTNVVMSNGDNERLFKIVDFLVAKEALAHADKLHQPSKGHPQAQ